MFYFDIAFLFSKVDFKSFIAVNNKNWKKKKEMIAEKKKKRKSGRSQKRDIKLLKLHKLEKMGESSDNVCH